MVSNPAPELETDCLECKNKKDKDVTEKLTEKIKPNWKNTDIPKFCEEAAKVGFVEKQYEGNYALLQKVIDTKDYKALKGLTWKNTLYPSYDYRLLNHNSVLNTVTDDLFYKNEDDGKELPFGTDIKKFLEELPKSDPYLSSWKSELDWSKVSKFTAQADVQKIQKAMAVKNLLCAQYGITNVEDCAKGLTKIIELMSSEYDGGELEPVIREVMQDPDYTKASVRLALKIQSKVDKRGIPKGDFYSDAFDSFKELGLSDEVAEEKAFNLIGVFSTTGACVVSKFKFYSKATAPMYYALSVVGTGLSVLNSASQGSDHLYSNPASVKGSCDNGKPYHFWMTAFFARKLAKEFGNQKAAISASYLAELGYQMNASYFGRDPNRAFMTESMGPANNKIRVDLASAGAGAVFGASKGANKPLKKNINVDEGLRNLLEDSGKKESLSEEETKKLWQGNGVEAYLRWRNIFSPDSSLDLYKKSLK